MLFQKKTRFKPLFKHFIKLRINVYNRTKVLSFKKKKWETFLFHYNKSLKRYKKFKPQSQIKYIVDQYPYKILSYKKQYRKTLYTSYIFRLFYGFINKKKLKKNIVKIKSQKFNIANLVFLKLFEQKLDTVLYRAKFCSSIRKARQLILHDKILVNNQKISYPSFVLKPGDIISVNSNYHFLVEKNLKKTKMWPIPPKYLTINYKTLEIFFGTISPNYLYSTDFLFDLNLEKILIDYYYR